MDWQPIETAPKQTSGDLAYIDLWVEGEGRIPDAFWLYDLEPKPAWYAENMGWDGASGPVEGNITHWMPRPEPPPQT